MSDPKCNHESSEKNHVDSLATPAASQTSSTFIALLNAYQAYKAGVPGALNIENQSPYVLKYANTFWLNNIMGLNIPGFSIPGNGKGAEIPFAASAWSDAKLGVAYDYCENFSEGGKRRIFIFTQWKSATFAFMGACAPFWSKDANGVLQPPELPPLKIPDPKDKNKLIYNSEWGLKSIWEVGVFDATPDKLEIKYLTNGNTIHVLVQKQSSTQ
ncbi:hypothetical protein MJO52_11750 [Microbulbifer variabilis]|uniref:Uncharacterized protein n=1 Tax=Microbulbifer variabilis TaxID=266805 RepID=A0ABY4V655_9GAMM|nr:hypothetical protein [Microbulbifer variabilis]USD19756.1 hypothetical protein MJO52_11750 [Microbulbifer variabilis]